MENRQFPLFFVIGITRDLPRPHYRWGFQKREPFGRSRDLKHSGRYYLIP